MPKMYIMLRGQVLPDYILSPHAAADKQHTMKRSVAPSQIPCCLGCCQRLVVQERRLSTVQRQASQRPIAREMTRAHKRRQAARRRLHCKSQVLSDPSAPTNFIKHLNVISPHLGCCEYMPAWP